MSIQSTKPQLWIKVLYDFKYTTREGQEVTIIKNEKLLLLEKTNTDWWHAQRLSEKDPFYVPATYVEEIPENDCQENVTNTFAKKCGSDEQASVIQSTESEVQDPQPVKEERRNNESFRNVIRKISGNLNSSTKPLKAVKLTKKNSMNTHDEKKPKSDNMSEASAFAKCFGRDMKNSDNRPQNRFQEELESAVIHRSQRNIVYSSKLDEQSEPKPNIEKPINLAEKAVSQQKLEKLTQKLQDNKTKAMENLTKELESRVHRHPKAKEVENDSSVNKTVNLKVLKKPPTLEAVKRAKLKIELVKDEPKHEKECNTEKLQKSSNKTSKISEMDDEAILNDNRKMWAIERLMSELLKSSERKMSMSTLNEEIDEDKDADKLAQELYDMQSNKSNKSKEDNVIFDFSVNPNAVAPKTVSKKSPKVLDEYNEANILNDNDNEEQKKLDYEKPSYSSVSFRSRNKTMSNLCVKLKRLDSDLQLTPSLEKLASEIQFLPANRITEEVKQCSKSDSALNEYSRPKNVPNNFRSLDKNYEYSKKIVKPKRLHVFSRKLSFAVKTESDKRKQQLKRKTRSLDDLNLVEENVPSLSLNVKDNLSNKNKIDAKKKPTQLFKSTDSLRKGTTKPVPAKRSVFDTSGLTDSDLGFNDKCDFRPKWIIDLEKSTAVGFKTLLRTSDSGSEEFLQNKTFPMFDDDPKYSSNNSIFQETENLKQSDSSRNPSSEMILSSIESLESNANASFEASGKTDNYVQLPDGWKRAIDLKTRQLCYVNDNGDKWFSSNDSEGKIYFFEENSNKSSWALPVVKNKSTSRNNSIDNLKMIDVKLNKKVGDNREKMDDLKHNNWPQLFHGNMCILKEGHLNRTKITEHGKKLKKCWSTSYAVLTELFLLFFKDEKIFSAMKMGLLSTAKPDISVDLNGASIESGEKFSSRKNVFLISTIFGLQVLIQCDNSLQSTEWCQEIQDAVKALPSGRDHGKCTYSEE